LSGGCVDGGNEELLGVIREEEVPDVSVVYFA
jgi:hypothetical protein